MGTTLQEIGTMVPFVGGDGRPDANLYLGMVAVTGGAMWAVNAGVYRLTHAGEHSHAQHASGVDPVGLAGAVTLAWVGLTALWIAMARSGLKREVARSVPWLGWLAVTVVAFGANVAGFVVDSTAATQLMWMPWLGSMAVGYLLTGVLVQRSGVYYLSGAFSLFALVVALGVVPVWVTGLTELSALTFLLLGALHTLPMAVDAARGGRQIGEDGRPQLDSKESPSVTVNDD